MKMINSLSVARRNTDTHSTHFRSLDNRKRFRCVNIEEDLKSGGTRLDLSTMTSLNEACSLQTCQYGYM